MSGILRESKSIAEMKKQKMYFIEGIDYSMSESEVREWLLEYGLSEIKVTEVGGSKTIIKLHETS
jgi:hypothetical protein